MKQGKYWCLALAAAALLLFGAQIWTGDGRFGGVATLAVIAAIVAGFVGISQAVNAEGRELKEHLGMGRTLTLEDLLSLPDSAIVEDSRGYVWQKWPLHFGGSLDACPAWISFGTMQIIHTGQLAQSAPVKLVKESTGQVKPHVFPEGSTLFVFKHWQEQAREGGD